MAITRTYAVGASNVVRRLDNHVGPWIDVSPAIDANPTWLDVMTDPNDPEKLAIVGNGIMVSHDAGASWFVPGGNWVNAKEFFEVWYVDSDIIWVVGLQGFVAKSTDGGLNFYSSLNYIEDKSIPFTTAIHAIDEFTAVVAGSPTTNTSEPVARVWKTIDGGISWIDLNGGASLANTGPGITVGAADGIWMSADQREIVVGTGYTQNRSTDFGATFTDVAPEILRSGRHLTWFPSYDPNPPYMRHVGGTTTHVNESLDNGATWSTTRNNEAIQIRGAHFYSTNNGYYTVGGITYSTTDGAVTGTVSDPHILTGTDTMWAVWTSLAVDIYEISDCSGEQDTIYSTSPLLLPQIGNIVNLNIKDFPSDVCWEVALWEGDPGVPLTLVTGVLGTFIDCEDCLPTPDPSICWDLISCNEDCDDILSVTGTDFTPHIGQLVTINQDTSCVFEPFAVRQAVFTNIPTTPLSNPVGTFQSGSDNITLEITSFILNGTEYIVGTAPTYLLTPGVYAPVECTGLTCVSVLPNTTENSFENVPVFINNLINSLGIVGLEVFANDPLNCALVGNPETFRVQYRDGDIFSIVFNTSSLSAGSTSTLLEVTSGNIAQKTNLIIGGPAVETCSSNLYCGLSGQTTVQSVQPWLLPCPTPPVPPTAPELGEACDIAPRLGEPGFSVKNCDPKKVISIKTRYADSVYALFKRMRFGIETCCEFDLDKIDVSNMLIDLGAIFDPDICEALTVEPVDCCPPPCNAVAQIHVPLAVGCPAPINAIISTTLVPFTCPAPVGLSGNPFASANVSIV